MTKKWAWLIATAALASAPLVAQGPPEVDPLAARVDPYSPKPRIIVLTDIANEPDDQMSMVRLLVYSNQFDIEGLVATTSTWMRNRVRPDVIQSVIDAYAEVRPNLLKHQPGFPEAAALKALVVPGQPGVRHGRRRSDKLRSAGSDADRAMRPADDPRPLWIAALGRHEHACAGADGRARHASTAELDALVSRLRVYSISDQDDAGPWIRREYPRLHYIVSPSTPDGAGVRLRDVDRHQRRPLLPQRARRRLHDLHRRLGERATSARKGPLGKLYPYPCCIHEGDTPSFLGLIDNGLASAMSPTFGGWGGRYVWRQPSR